VKKLTLGLFLIGSCLAQTFYTDLDTDCFYIPKKVLNEKKIVPTLLYLHCQGATKAHLDSIKFVADTLGWILVSVHKSKNHQNPLDNDRYILNTYRKALKLPYVDSTRVFIYGFSGQGVQALITLFLHPRLFKGVISECAHRQALPFADWVTLKDKLIYLSSRTEDWNLYDNYYLDSIFKAHKLKDTLVIKPGEHSMGTPQDLIKALTWLSKNMRDKKHLGR
jgi:predicted peptidase